ncbi:HAD family hydrolase [Candidatus Epulonipiscium fishelsonii]|uniref:HAD family hydrolase n=1 Tax=Candidatus Epulonipiscium fishelsonii TaxID=77094 RepID=A0ACC8XAN6_9FIRM|nr:HAD family hydrolase [Epulopiscium sp. SCG-B11WGA-EpuloA1]ONI40154.1 HAD family hydrolase [Epulopiscium sp. SCG-B05WGA-EpuloA1]
MYKIVTIDMDGTLLRSDKTISDFTKETLKQVQNKGTKIVIASGRPLAGIEHYLEELNLNTEDDYVISFNGALVRNVATKKIIAHTVLYGQDLLDIYEISKQLGLNMHAFSNQGCITTCLSKYSELEGTMNKIPVNIIDYKTIKPDDEIIKIMLVDEPDKLEVAIKKLPKELYEKYTIVRSAPFFLEFLNKEANKGVGLEKLAKHLNIPKEETMAFGDAGNDEHMIKFAGMGVAMGNAFPEIKAIAKHVTSSNDEDGVARALRKFVLEE